VSNSDKPSDNDNKLFSLPLEYAYGLIADNDEQLSMAKDLLSDFLKDEKINNSILFILVEILFANFSVLKIFNEEIETAVFHENENSGEKELVLSRSSIQMLQSLLLSKHYAISRLNKLSYSISLH
jgi:hypothetical protein